MVGLNGWHKGERAIQCKLGFDGVVSLAWRDVHPEMTEQHQTFYTTRLPFIPVTTIDDRQRPWSSILAGRGGEPGFATSKSFGELTMNISPWEGDPFLENVGMGDGRGLKLIAGIGVEFSTRRRNKFAGYVESVERDGDVFRVRSVVNEALGNCPKYINVRELVAWPDTHPRVLHRRVDLSANERLPSDVISFILESDTLFLGTLYSASEEDRAKFPSHVGMNHRGGKPGFVRVRPSDGRTLVLPDYSGNRLMTSLGNIEATPVASFTFVSFMTGSILYLTGHAQNIVGAEAQRLMPRTNALTTLYVTGFIFVSDALPVRQRPGSVANRSPYSPPTRLLAEETYSTYFDDSTTQRSVTLASVELHSRDLATFTFESPSPLEITPGQTAILDFKSFIGPLSYRHMAPENPIVVNDDRIRTWTISSSSTWSGPSSKNVNNDDHGTTSFALTMRHKSGGAVTGALFSIIHALVKDRPDLLKNARPLQLNVPLVGIAGDFTLPTPAELPPYSPHHTRRKLFWIAGGIGLTPFLAMLNGLRWKETADIQYDITLVLSTREPEVLLPLVMRAAQPRSDEHSGNAISSLHLLIHVFSRAPQPLSLTEATGSIMDVVYHSGRVEKDTFRGLGLTDLETQPPVYVCGPEGFEEVVTEALREVGVRSQMVKREGFAY
ncbi:hypothetical protein F5I97DRAFT_1810448 [Phlebopus sp. FC_14]|nr:hypothetical protein F5I97DRAFT_1810448 [Phlebopus sp. FC_14]